MSCYEQERGTLTLPTAAIVPMRRALVDAVNTRRTEIISLATRIHAHLLSDAGKPDRKALSAIFRKPSKFSGDHEQFEFFAKLAQRVDRAYHPLPEEKISAMMRLLVVRNKEPGKPSKLQAPKKKDMPLLPAQTLAFHDDECSVVIDPKSRTVRWGTADNNHAVENAWQTPLGVAFSSALSKVEWTRGTGGVFYYTNEYQRDNELDDGHNPVSIRHDYGPLGKAQREEHSGFRRRSVRPRAKRSP